MVDGAVDAVPTRVGWAGWVHRPSGPSPGARFTLGSDPVGSKRGGRPSEQRVFQPRASNCWSILS